MVWTCLQDYAETKAMGEVALRQACDGKDLLTVAIAPHQVYGPRDMLFLPNLLIAAGTHTAPWADMAFGSIARTE